MFQRTFYVLFCVLKVLKNKMINNGLEMNANSTRLKLEPNKLNYTFWKRRIVILCLIGAEK
jgi:hypothetical protein